MKIYVIGGKAKTGKSTFGELLKEELKDYGYKPCIMHLTEPLYTYARNFFNWNGNESEKPREFLQKMGIEIIKEKLGKEDFLLRRFYEDVEILSTFFDTFIIVDARLIDEFKSIKNHFDEVVTIKVERTKYEDYLSEEEKEHRTETEIDHFHEFDYIIENKSLKDLKESVMEIVRNEEKDGDTV